jgi:hypothetical protein
MPVHIKDGTPVYGPSLCDTCTNAHIRHGYRASEKVVICFANSPAERVAFPVRECSGYSDRTKQSLWEMQKIAWVLSPRGPKRKAGFAPPPKGRAEEERVELILEENE